VVTKYNAIELANTISIVKNFTNLIEIIANKNRINEVITKSKIKTEQNVKIPLSEKKFKCL
jgi:hypothetical protein